MFARMAMLLMVAVDVIMCGRMNAQALAYYGIARMPSQMLFLTGLGALTGVTVLCAQAHGRGRDAECGEIWRAGLWMGLGLGVIATGATMFSEPFFRLTGQEEQIAREGANLMRIFGLGMLPLMLGAATVLYLEGIGRPLAGLIVALIGNVLNLLLNAWMIYPMSGWGLGWGATGAVSATVITRAVMFLMLLYYALHMSDTERFGAGLSNPWSGTAVWRRLPILIRIGWPMGLAQGLEAGAFTALNLIAGAIGATVLAAYQIVQNLFVTIYVSALGLATAVCIRVGRAVGRGDERAAARAGWIGVGLVLPCMIFGALLVLFLRESLTLLHTHDPRVSALSVAAMLWFLSALPADGCQSALVGALRGTGDFWTPTFCVNAGFWGVSIPWAWWWGFHGGWGVSALMGAMGLGATVAAILAAWRFQTVTRTQIQPL